MKRMLKVLSALLALMTVLLLAACTKPDTVFNEEAIGNGSNPGAETGASNGGEEQFFPGPAAAHPDFGGARFDGETVKFYLTVGAFGNEDDPEVRSITLAGNTNDPENEIDAAVKRRNEKLAEELGVKAEVVGTARMQDAASALRPILASHIYTFDVLGLSQYYALDLVTSSLSFYDYCNLPAGSYLNLDAPYWNKALFDASRAPGQPAHFLTGDICRAASESMYVSFVNMRLWNEFKEEIKALPSNPEGLESVYDLVKKGYWTMDLWSDICKLMYKDLNENGIKDREDRAGLLTYDRSLDNVMGEIIAAGAHQSFLKTGGEKLSFEFTSEKNVGFAYKIAALLCDSNAVTVPWTTDAQGNGVSIMEMFKEGNALLTANVLSAAYDLKDAADEYRVLPPPLYDHAQFDASSPSLGCASRTGDSVTHYAICRDAGDARIPVITATLELMGYYSYTEVTPAIYDLALNGRRSSSADDREMLRITRAGVYSDYSVFWSKYLGNINWFYRTNYDYVKTVGDAKLTRELRLLEDDKNHKLKELFTVIYPEVIYD